jgi:histidine decarboxylase
MLEATRKLFGTVDDRKFPLIPGSHVPCAGKNIKIEGPGRIYSAAAVGMASNRNTAACLLMEDVGRIPVELKGQELQDYRHNILKKIAESVVQIGQNQECKYDAIYVGMTDEVADKNEIACALVAAPYFTLAKEAAKPFIQKKTSQLTLAEWAKKVL